LGLPLWIISGTHRHTLRNTVFGFPPVVSPTAVRSTVTSVVVTWYHGAWPIKSSLNNKRYRKEFIVV